MTWSDGGQRHGINYGTGGSGYRDQELVSRKGYGKRLDRVVKVGLRSSSSERKVGIWLSVLSYQTNFSQS
jgi:hypothetical protein